MSKLKLLYRLFFSIIMVVSCNTKQNYDDVSANLKKIDKKDNSYLSKYYVVIPNQGCEGCISYTEAFVRENYNKYQNLKFIFTRMNSIKLVLVRVGLNALRSNKIILDTLNIFTYPEDNNNIYPAIITTDTKKVINIEYQSPQNEGIEHLLSKLNKR
ncbi:hypothetical protein A9P82_04420 [Arachidicoccus ginsenosidimutans]|uniref:hypothetical protein n=1 Tax=Arachidicoccus sp. BS20 TaxID=1850526 RepID=UPI0007F15162|nr:hypothetical protein [Arachidicoccus sp. BS20]ANI88598.1 hypothetical protein A9P82_04420 [Arachidicoccus sp. BS20]